MKNAELLTTKEVAALLKVAPATLVDWRHKQRGPLYYRMKREIRYKLVDILQWQQQILEPAKLKSL